MNSLHNGSALPVWFLRLFITVAAILIAPIAWAQPFPSRPITLIVGYPPGGSNDIAARAVAPAMSEILGVSVVIENKPGAAGMISGTYTSRATPDGYTLLLSSLSPIIVSPQTLKSPPFHTPTDFVAINRIGLIPLGIALGPNLQTVKTMTELIAVAKTRDVTLSSAGTGGLSHLLIELLASTTKARFVHVPYKGAAPAITDTVAGHVDGISMDISPLMPMLVDGRLRGLAVTSTERISAFPNIPSIQEILPNFSAVNWVAIFAPPKTPAPIVSKINDAIKKAIAQPAVLAKLESVGIIPAVMDSPAAFQGFVNSEYTRWGKVLKDANIEKTD